MSVYLVAMVKVHDPETYKKYTTRTPDVIQQHGGRFVVRGGPVETVEGPEFKDRLVVVEFPSMEAFKNFHASEEYQEIMKHRLASADSTFIVAEGVPEGVVAPDAHVTKSG